MTRFKVRASGFLFDKTVKGRLAHGRDVIRRETPQVSVAEARDALRHAVASARLEMVAVTGDVRRDAVKEAMKPLRKRYANKKGSQK